MAVGFEVVVPSEAGPGSGWSQWRRVATVAVCLVAAVLVLAVSVSSPRAEAFSAADTLKSAAGHGSGLNQKSYINSLINGNGEVEDSWKNQLRAYVSPQQVKALKRLKKRQAQMAKDLKQLSKEIRSHSLAPTKVLIRHAPAGPPGPTGYKGVTGRRGRRGPMGRKGPKGPTGAVGVVGRVGPKGRTGPTGPMGVPGAAGTNGRPGRMGESGPKGVKGLSGAPGRPGRPGRNGRNGARGPRGDAGRDGPAGPRGATGPRGHRGKNGLNGYVGRRTPPEFSRKKVGWAFSGGAWKVARSYKAAKARCKSLGKACIGFHKKVRGSIYYLMPKGRRWAKYRGFEGWQKED